LVATQFVEQAQSAAEVGDLSERIPACRCSGHQLRSLLRAGGSGFHLTLLRPVPGAITSAQLAIARCDRSTLIRRTHHTIGWRC
jgi:hypothetical protein